MDDTIYNFTRLFNKTLTIFNDNFNNRVDVYEDRCSSFISENSISDSSFISYCKKFMRYLEYIDEENTSEGNDIYLNRAQAILYLYIWINDNELFGSNYKVSLDIYRKLLKSYDVKSNSIMKVIYDIFIRNNITENLKLIYNLYYKFDQLKNNNECQSKKCKCVQECVHLYTQVLNDCNRDVNADYCNELEIFRQIYHSHMKDDTECDVKYKYLPSPIKSNIALISVPVAIILITSILFLLYKVCNNLILMYVYYTF
ncbi:hypothetical protein PCYB_003590 [Plasmodium cynomolgi strain B]|uniref:Variable surface protein n=1 Tax=Plasmodium cynomolgi (strain B) TaxID=1120755 RepID=K6V2T8_PLACD|nr:hypothetical protein PCYB_003590 [Plasmodium cynomolgi strain B]GAB69610.1 hypothetical protein PCYB_003590 [Plasmodium cynomolgi strain B]